MWQVQPIPIWLHSKHVETILSFHCFVSVTVVVTHGCHGYTFGLVSSRATPSFHRAPFPFHHAPFIMHNSSSQT